MNVNTEKNQKSGIFAKLINFISLKEKTDLPSGITDEDEELIQNIKNIRREWLWAISKFNYAEELAIIDYLTYTIKAYEIKYEYLLKKAKEKGIKVDTLEKSELVLSRSY